MKKLLNIIAIALLVILLAVTACQSGGSETRTPIPVKDMFPLFGEQEAPDDIMPVPGGGPVYRANFHQEGIENPWPPIEITKVFLGSGSNEAHIYYRDYIETKAGETRNNVIKVIMPSKEVRSLSLYAIDVPDGISLTDGMRWSGPNAMASVLVIEISLDVALGQYTIEIGVEIDGKNYGKVPCIIKVTPETTPTPVPPSVSFFPIQLDKYAKEAYPSALATGILALDNGRLRLKPITGIGDSNLLIWPPDFSVHIQDNTIHILNKDGNTVARVGDKIKAGGGQVPAEIVEKYIGQPLPDNCPGPYWLVSEVVTDE